MSGAMVMLLPTMKDAMTMMPNFGSSRTDKDGNFTLSGVAPGEYSIQIQSLAEMMKQANQAMALIGAGDSATAAPPAQSLEREFAVATVNVTGDDIKGLVVTGARGARASGRLVFEDGPAPADLASLRLMAEPTDSDNMAAMASSFGLATVKKNGTFEIDGLVGGRAFSFMNPPAGWSLKRVTHEGDDVTDKGYVFKPGEDVEGFEIVMTTKSQPLSGSVTNDKGEPVKDCTVVVFPEDRQQWAASNDRTRGSARPDQQGQFKFTSLPAGSYLAIAVEYVAEGEWADPEWLARAAKKATPFTLVEGAPKTLDLKLSGS